MIWKIIGGLVAAVAAFLIFGAMVGNTPEGKEKQRARDAIDLCRSNERQWSGGAQAKSVITGACQQLEDDFRSRFGRNP
jgi:hypothetical protein